MWEEDQDFDRKTDIDFSVRATQESVVVPPIVVPPLQPSDRPDVGEMGHHHYNNNNSNNNSNNSNNYNNNNNSNNSNNNNNSNYNNNNNNNSQVIAAATAAALAVTSSQQHAWQQSSWTYKTLFIVGSILAVAIIVVFIEAYRTGRSVRTQRLHKKIVDFMK